MSPTRAQQRVLTFFVGNESFALPALEVSEIVRRPKVTRVPYAPPSLIGLTAFRGVPAPVISLARLLGHEERESKSSRVLLLAGRRSIGLAVDEVGALDQFPVEDDEAGPARGLGRLYRTEGGVLRLLDLESLIRQDFATVALGAQSVQVQEAGAQIETAEESVALLGFHIADQAYGLLLDEIEEVLPLPTEIAEVAQSHAAALGVINLRDQLLPIVSLRSLLGLPPSQARAGKAIVARIGSSRVGLAVDQLDAILRMPVSSMDAAPTALNRGDGTAQVEAICRLPGGRGLVAVLSAKRLFSDVKTAEILAGGRETESATATKEDQKLMAERFVIFRIGEEEFGLPIEAVDEVLRVPEKLTRVPKAPPFIEGVLNLRGKITPVIDQRRRFNATTDDTTGKPRLVVTTVAGRQAGFIVDAVSEILSLRADQIEETSSLGADAAGLFTRVASLAGGERLALLVEPKELLDRAERDLLAGLDDAVMAPS